MYNILHILSLMKAINYLDLGVYDLLILNLLDESIEIS